MHQKKTAKQTECGNPPLMATPVAAGFPSPAEQYIESPLDLNELLGLMDQPQQDTSGEDMNEDPLPELTEEEMFGDTPAETDDQSAALRDL